MKFESLTNLVSDIESKHAVSLKGELLLLRQLEGHHGYTAVIDFLDQWCKAFLRSAECRSRQPLRALALEGVSPRIAGGVKNFASPLLEKIYDVDGKEHSDPCPEAFRDLYQMGSLLTKFGAADISQEMQTKALVNYESDEYSVSTSNPAETLPAEIIVLARKAIEDLLQYAPSYVDMLGRHGPGSVAEGTRNPAEKYAKWHIPRDVSLNTLPGLRHYLDVANPVSHLDGFDPYKSKVCVVPKSWNKCRTICAEPALLQFCQQSLARELDLTLRLGRLNGCHTIDLHDQFQNADKALEGSLWWGSWATLDLSSASDLLSMKLVELLWPELWVNRLTAVRSKRTELPDGRVLELEKFASMGNAVTFPIQSITFWALAVAASLLDRAAGASANEVYREVSVYGDDIICRDSVASSVMGVLTSAGLRVNMNKSYYKGRFRESCGLHAYDGNEVTPAYLRTDKYDPSGCVSQVATANALWARGYAMAAEEIFARIESKLKMRLPYSNVGGQLVRQVDASLPEILALNQEMGIPLRWNRYQSGFEAKSYLLKPIGREFLEFRDMGDMWAFCVPSLSDMDRGIRSAPGLKLSLAWVAVC